MTAAEEVIDALQDVAFVCDCGEEIRSIPLGHFDTVYCTVCTRGWRSAWTVGSELPHHWYVAYAPRRRRP